MHTSSSAPDLARLYPLTFDPVFKDYPWGGRNLATRLGRVLPEGIVAESWDIAAHPNGSSVVCSGPLCGKTLVDVLDLWGEHLVGTRNRRALNVGRFPLLVKLLDANRWLSVQVHPDDAYAYEHEGEPGKTEMWVVLHAEPGAELIYGFRPGVDREQFATAIAADDTERCLQRVPVAKGDVIFVPAGAIHALGPGIIVAEIQQNSDTTYRIYDWGRPRALHIEKALDVLDFDLAAPAVVTPVALPGAPVPAEVTAECAYFRTERMHVASEVAIAGCCDGTTFEIWGVLEGSARVVWGDTALEVQEVGWVLLPAALGDFTVEAQPGTTLLRVITPEGS